MSEFNIEDLDAVIARCREDSLAQMLALHLKGQIRKGDQLAAENAGLKAAGNKMFLSAISLMEAPELKIDHARDIKDWEGIKTPSTDAFLAEVRASARNEGIKFAASRLAAAFNHGFVDKPMAEVFDVVRMILTAKEDLASNPAEDGLSGEYAEKSLAEWEAVLREGANQ